MIDDNEILVKDKNVLEFGCGTGIVGLVSAQMGSQLTVMSDHHPEVIDNAVKNIALNQGENIKCVKLDWSWCVASDFKKELPILRNTTWNIIIAADCIYDLFHAAILPIAAKHYLSKEDPMARFHVLLPHRLQFKEAIDEFEKNMPLNGWVLEHSHWIRKHALTFRYYIFRGS
jgi:predicted nicotinamide N-methyase